MTESHLRERIAAGEGQRVEFESALWHADELASDLTRFANAEAAEIHVVLRLAA